MSEISAGIGFQGLPKRFLTRSADHPKLRNLSWVDVLIAFGLVFDRELETYPRPEDSPTLTELKESGWDYFCWLRSVELLLENVFPRLNAIRHVTSKGPWFKIDRVRTALGLLTVARRKARSARRRARMFTSIGWSARIVRLAIAFSWIAIALAVPFSLLVSLPVLWLTHAIAQAVESVARGQARREGRRALIVSPPLRPGKFVLYLRSFASDSEVTDSAPLPLHHQASRFPLWSSGPSLFVRFAEALAPIGPVVALGWPEDLSRDTIGIPTLALPQKSWQEFAIQAANDAAAIIIDHGRLKVGGHLWELKQVMETDLLYKTIFLLPYDSPPDLETILDNYASSRRLPPDYVPSKFLATMVGLRQMDEAWIRYNILKKMAFADAGLAIPEYDPDALFLYFDEDRVAHLVPCRPPDEIPIDTTVTDTVVASRAQAVKLLERAFPKFRPTQSDRAELRHKSIRFALLVACHVGQIILVLCSR